MDQKKYEVKECLINIENITYENMNIIHLESDEEISIYIGGDELSTLNIQNFFNENNLKGTFQIKGIDGNGENYTLDTKNPNEMKLNLNPFYLALNFPK